MRRLALLFAAATAVAACGELLGNRANDEPDPMRTKDDAGAGITSDAPGTDDAGTDTGGRIGCLGAEPCERFVFTTSATYQGDLGGITGADAKCNTAAGASAMDEIRRREFVAWISTTTSAAAGRLTHGTAAYKLPDGTHVSESWTGFASVLHAAAMTQDENGHTISEENSVWTGTLPSGQPAGQNCGGWVFSNGDGTYGTPNLYTNPAWSADNNGECESLNHLYCIER